MNEVEEVFGRWMAHDGFVDDLFSPLMTAVDKADFGRLHELLPKATTEELERRAILADGHTLRPVHLAANLRGDAVSSAVLTMLLKAGANPNSMSHSVRDRQNLKSLWTPLFMSVRGKRLASACALIAHGADVNLACGDWTPLHLAAEKDDAVMIHMLASHKADVDVKSTGKRKWTPLHSAAFHGAEKACKALWCEGAALDKRDAENMTPIDVAREKGHENIVALMMLLGAKNEALEISDATATGTSSNSTKRSRRI